MRPPQSRDEAVGMRWNRRARRVMEFERGESIRERLDRKTTASWCMSHHMTAPRRCQSMSTSLHVRGHV